jgi:hypothetical protein
MTAQNKREQSVETEAKWPLGDMRARRMLPCANLERRSRKKGEEASVGGREESYVSIHDREGFMVDLPVCS